MSKRLQVLFEESEYRELQRVAQRNGVSVSQWVRSALRAMRRREAQGDPESKLEAVRVAARFDFPTADIDQMLAEIEAGYGGRHAP